MIKFILASLLCLHLSLALEITETSGEVQFQQGTSDSIFCQADAALNYCTWMIGENECLISKGQETSCEGYDNIRGVIEDGKCSLNFDGPTRENVGTYSCLLYAGRENSEGMKCDIIVLQKIKYRISPK